MLISGSTGGVFFFEKFFTKHLHLLLCDRKHFLQIIAFIMSIPYCLSSVYPVPYLPQKKRECTKNIITYRFHNIFKQKKLKKNFFWIDIN